MRTEGWRNLAPASLRFESRISVLWGDNGQGKTNLLEAVYFLAAQRSFRTTRISDLIQVGTAFARLSATIDSDGIERSVEVSIRQGIRESRLDGKVVRGATAFFGGLAAVLFVPEDLLLVKAPPVARRRFIDLAIFGIERGYFEEAIAFQRVLRSRNAVLRSGAVDKRLLDTYDEELSRTGARLVMRRRKLVESIVPLVAQHISAVSQGPDEAGTGMEVDIAYRSGPTVENAGTEPTVREALLEGLWSRRALDARRGFTTFGPQTDDVEFRLGGRPAREHASQGQIRAFVLALKLAEVCLVSSKAGVMPVLLLDDVAGELDPKRRGYLFHAISRLTCQTMVSITDLSLLPTLPDRQDFQVVNGTFRFT